MKRLLLVPAIAAGLIAISAGAAYASEYVAYEGRAFSGRSVAITACGMSNIPYHGSYKWYGTGQDGRMYNQPNAQGVAHFTLRGNAEQRTAVGWKSIFIVC